MVYVEVLYSDLSRQRVPIDEIDTLPKDSVLFISVLASDGEKFRRLTASFSFDHYALCRRKSGGVDWIMLSGWDDGDFIWRKAANPWNPAGRLDEGPPLGCMHVVFNGVHVAPEVWKEAQGLFTEDSLSNR
ncbi:MAG: hypothetical protein KKD44_25905 [Proteobacteria bacterium]|nr:hypothetical protein [Pseudomonadota bacterium]